MKRAGGLGGRGFAPWVSRRFESWESEDMVGDGLGFVKGVGVVGIDRGTVGVCGLTSKRVVGWTTAVREGREKGRVRMFMGPLKSWREWKEEKPLEKLVTLSSSELVELSDGGNRYVEGLVESLCLFRKGLKRSANIFLHEYGNHFSFFYYHGGAFSIKVERDFYAGHYGCVRFFSFVRSGFLPVLLLVRIDTSTKCIFGAYFSALCGRTAGRLDSIDYVEE